MEDKGLIYQELQQLRKLVPKLATEIDVKNMRLFHMEEKYDQLSTTLKNTVIEKRKLQQDHAKGVSSSTSPDIFLMNNMMIMH